jgi:hypothetical protein
MPTELKMIGVEKPAEYKLNFNKRISGLTKSNKVTGNFHLFLGWQINQTLRAMVCYVLFPSGM